MNKLIAADAAAGDNFGVAVAISGSKIVVGAYKDDDKGIDSGSAYIFDTTGHHQVKKIVASDGAAGDLFGYPVALDGSTIVIGASNSAYAFDAAGENEKKLTAPGVVPGDSFGFSVAVDGSTIVVGAYTDDDNGIDSGSAYIFDTAGQYVTNLVPPPDAAAGDNFGVQVAVDGSTIVVGAWRKDDIGSNSGSAYVFDTNGQYVKKLVPPDAAAGDYFGRSVAVGGSTIVVGSYRDGDNGIDSGSAYIFL